MASGPTRDFTATTFVVWRQSTLLHRHQKLDLWLPCGGHIEADELPDEAACREVFEESGVRVVLQGERGLAVGRPTQLIRPRGVQLEEISDGHEHIDLIYFAAPVEPYCGGLLAGDPSLGWYPAAALRDMDLTAEVRAWCQLALNALGDPRP